MFNALKKSKLFAGATVAIAMSTLVGCAATTTTDEAADVKVAISAGMGSVELMHNGQPVTVMRNQDTNNTVNPAFAKTSRPCPPFCIQPFNLAPGVETVAELEVLDYAKRMSDGDDSIMLVDSRTPDWVAKGTIPGAVNVPFTKLFEGKGADPVTIAESLEMFGAVEADGNWNYDNAKTLVLFCNGMWCGQSPHSIRSLLKYGYPASKIKWYRGGMQNWEILGFNTVKP